ncbi:MAG: hypothetical protein WC593_00500 [Methanoregula sp.]
MEKKMKVFRKCIMVTSVVAVILWTLISIVSGVPLYDSINVPSSTVGQGQPWILTGTAPGDENIQVWIFGPVEVLFFLQKVESDGSYSISLLPEKTREMDPGNYHAVLQFPHEPGLYDIRVRDWEVINTKKPASQQQIFSLLPGPHTPFSRIAYASLIQALNDPAVNDTYAEESFFIIPAHGTEPEKVPILIHPIEDHTVGDQFAINGTTTLFEGDEILVQIMPSSFVPGLKIPEGMQQGTTGIVSVMGSHKGDNTWRFQVDTTHWLADEYLVSAAAVTGNATASTLFTLYSGSIHIDPVSNHTVGDTFPITGTSVLSENNPLYVQLLYQPHILTKEITARQPSCGDTGGHATTINRTSQKYWSYVLNTSGCTPGTYRVEAFSSISQVWGDARQFEIYPDTNTTSRQTTGIFPATSNATPQTPTQQPAPVPLSIPFAALVICAGAAIFFRRLL